MPLHYNNNYQHWNEFVLSTGTNSKTANYTGSSAYCHILTTRLVVSSENTGSTLRAGFKLIPPHTHFTTRSLFPFSALTTIQLGTGGALKDHQGVRAKPS